MGLPVFREPKPASAESKPPARSRPRQGLPTMTGRRAWPQLPGAQAAPPPRSSNVSDPTSAARSTIRRAPPPQRRDRIGGAVENMEPLDTSAIYRLVQQPQTVNDDLEILWGEQRDQRSTQAVRTRQAHLLREQADRMRESLRAYVPPPVRPSELPRPSTTPATAPTANYILSDAPIRENDPIPSALPASLRPHTRHGSTDPQPTDIDLLPPLRRMGNRSINDSPSALRDEWRPASEFNDGLGDRERSLAPTSPETYHYWTPAAVPVYQGRPHGRSDLPTMPGDSATDQDSDGDLTDPDDSPLNAEDDLLNRAAPLPTWGLPPLSALASNYCDDEPDITHLEVLVERYREARAEEGARGLRLARLTLRDMRVVVERLEGRRDAARAAGAGAGVMARVGLDTGMTHTGAEIRAIMERMERIEAEVEGSDAVL